MVSIHFYNCEYKMDNVKYFKDLFELTPDCRKIVLLMFLIKHDNDLFTE